MLKGIDISSIQNDKGPIDWQQVADSGIDFAIFRCVRETSEVDASFAENVAGARSVGILAGAYCYLDEDSEETQARRFVQAVNSVGGGLIQALDWERGAGTLPTIADVRAYTSIVRNAFPFQTQLVYGSAGVLGPRGDIAGWGPWWRADYGPKPYPEGTWEEVYAARGGDASAIWEDNALGYDRCLIWQFSSNGSVPGIKGRVDLNASKLSRAELEVLAGLVVPESEYETTSARYEAALRDLRGQLAAAPAIERSRIAAKFAEFVEGL